MYGLVNYLASAEQRITPTIGGAYLALALVLSLSLSLSLSSPINRPTKMLRLLTAAALTIRLL